MAIVIACYILFAALIALKLVVSARQKQPAPGKPARIGQRESPPELLTQYALLDALQAEAARLAEIVNDPTTPQKQLDRARQKQIATLRQIAQAEQKIAKAE